MLSTPVCFGVSVLLIAVTITLSNIGAESVLVGVVGYTGLLLFGLTTLLALGRGLFGLIAMVQAVRRGAAGSAYDGIAAVLGNFLMAGFGALVAYLAAFGFARGRQLRRFGRVLLPGLRSNAEWTKANLAAERLDGAPAGLAQQWRENGKTEHASVAAFARLTLDLMALGAPPALIAAANQDALDEIRHTELCFSLAYAMDGRPVSPGPFPQVQHVGSLPRSRTLALAKLAVDSLIDGALHEGVSARIIAGLARRCEVPPIRAALKEIAAEEGRHAAHGWSAMEWCLDTGGPAVGHALLGALRALPREMDSHLPEGAFEGDWEPWGIHGHAREAQEYRATLSHLVERVQALVARSSRRAA